MVKNKPMIVSSLGDKKNNIFFVKLAISLK